MVVEILLRVGGSDMDRGAELTVLNADIYVQKSDMGGGNVPVKVDRIATVEPSKKAVRESASGG